MSVKQGNAAARRSVLSRIGALAVSAAALAAVPAFSADVQWDITPGTVGVGNGTVTGGTGAWNTTNGNWTVDAGANNISWNNASNDNAIFGGPGGTVTLGTGITVGGLDFDVTGYTVTGNTLTLGAANNTFNVDAGSATVASVVAGGAGNLLTVTGPGILNLTSTTNSFLGDILVNGGQLRVDGSSTNRFGGSGAKTITLTNGGTYINHTGTLNPSAATKAWVIGDGGGTIQTDTLVQLDDPGQFGGTGDLIKSGTNVLFLNNQAYSFSGAINITAGTLRVGANAGVLGTGSAPITIGNNGVFDAQVTLSGARPINVSGTGISGGGALINSALNGNATITGPVTLATATAAVGGVGNLTLALPLDGGGNTTTLNKVGTGSLILNVAGTNFTNTTTANVTGGLRLNVPTALGAAANIVATGTNSGVVQLGAAAAGYSYTVPADGFIGGDAAFMNSLVVGAGGNLNLLPTTIAQTVAGLNDAIASTHSFANDNSRFFGIAADIGAETVTVGGGSPWRGISNDRLSRRLSTGTINANGNFDLQSLGGGLTFGNGSTAGNVAFVTANPITVALRGGGTILLDDTVPGWDSKITFEITSGTTLQTVQPNSLGGGATPAENAKVIVLNNGIINPNGGSTINGNVTIQPGGILNIDDATNLTGSGVITQFAGSITRITNNGGTALAGSQSPGTVAGSIVRLATNGINSLDTKIDHGAIFEVFGGTRTVANLTLNSVGAGTGVLTNDNASRTMNNTGTTTVNTVTIGAGGGAIAATTGTTFTIAVIGSNTTGGTLITGPSNTLTIGSTTSLGGNAKAGIVDIGGGTTSGINVAAINIVSGTLQNLSGGMPTTVGGGTGLITIQSGATLDTRTGTLTNGTLNVLAGGAARIRTGNGTDNTVGTAAVAGLQGAGTVFLGRSDTGANRDAAFSVGSNNVSTIFSGLIQDADATRNGQLIKTGTGTLALSGATGNTYTLGTIINGGLLQAMNTSGSATGPGAVTVNASGALGGTGIVTGTITFVGGGKLIPGASAGTLTTGPLSLVGTSELEYELGAPGVIGGGVNDLVVVNGNLALDGLLDITPLPGFAAGMYRLLDYTGTLTDNGLAFGDVPSGFSGAIDTTTPGQVNLVVSAVPEPTGLTLAAIGMVGLLARRRRQA